MSLHTTCSPTGAPWPPSNQGTGHLWPVLSDERAEYDLAADRSSSAASLLGAMRNMTSGQGLEPEQVWEDPPVAPSPFGTDPTKASIGFTNGRPVGSASPLTWAQATVARLTIDLGAGRTVETPDIVSDRYVVHGMPGTFALTIASLVPDSAGTSATVTGTTLPGANVDAETTPVGAGSATLVSTVADSGGHWSLTLPWGFGASPITVTATKGGRTAYAQASSVTLPGTQVFSTTDATGDDNGPGTYQYPTSSNFTAGSFDVTAFRVNQTATNVYLQISLRDLAPTFGSNFGAQMLDIYARDPSVASTSTTSAIPAENYTIAPAGAWTERVEADGFDPVKWVNAANVSIGSAQLVADPPSDTATIVLPRAAFGSVGSGWIFTVALTGQDGTNSTNLRAFDATPQEFAFGVCAPGGSSPICSVDPNTVPKVMDTITPAGVSQSAELNPTLGPVVLQGVTVP